jgi:extracellular factor (EF) 3-hydroxypalmitic acid methyl ester biosynthesis protein
VVLQISELLGDFKIILGERTAYSGRAVVHAVVNPGATLLCEATLSDAWLDPNIFADLADTSRLAEDFRSYLQIWHKQYKVLPDFKLHIADMQMFFMELRQWLDQVELGFGTVAGDRRENLVREVTGQLAASVIPSINGLFEKFEDLAAAMEEDLKPLHRAYMKRQLHPLVLCSPFAYRTFAKPLGYAGDYEMVNMIGRNGHEGSSLYAKVVNGWFLHQPPAVAHRNRITYLTQKIAEEAVLVRSQGRPLRLMNLACGPALELQSFLREWGISDGTEMSLLDFNEETIDHVSAVLAEIKRRHSRNAPVHLIKKSVLQILKEAGKTAGQSANPQYDLVYCAGLFDYLPDTVCQRLMNIMYRWLAPGGLLLATNVDNCNPLRHGMDFLLDWNLVYRNARQSLTLRPTEALQEATTVSTDITGVNLFIEVRKPIHV